jgi:3-hydroxymyristoyl/3-hydroxydecanoyl-(acyl carrier protein) dehydratase
MIYSGEDIKRLIPQRDPFMMVDTVEERDSTNAVTTLAVRQDNYFILRDNTLA